MRFRDFINEASKHPLFAPNNMPGKFRFPDLAGYERSHGVNPSFDVDSTEETVITATILRRFGELAEQARAAYDIKVRYLQTHGQSEKPNGYPYVEWDEKNEILSSLRHQDITGGNYPRIHQSEMDVALRDGILRIDPNVPNSYILDVRLLKQRFAEHTSKARNAAGLQAVGELGRKLYQSTMQNTLQIPDYTRAR